jgi:hypothetical protein
MPDVKFRFFGKAAAAFLLFLLILLAFHGRAGENYL